MPLTSQHLRDALQSVIEPESNRDLVTINAIREARIDGDSIKIALELKSLSNELTGQVRGAVESAIRAKAIEVGVTEPSVSVEFATTLPNANEQAREGGNPLPLVRQIIAVGAGKGGVGKSTISMALAIGLSRLGARTGLLDGDIYGPSMPTMLGLKDAPATARGSMLVPFDVHGIKAMTIGKLVDPEKPLIWRGPMAHGAFKQLATQTDWGALDYLIVDLPPGTGDVPLTLAQLLPLTGAVVVCTPQQVAQDDARRAIAMFRQLGVDILGVIENMSHYVSEDGVEHDLFGRGGAEMLAQACGTPYLGALPLHPSLRINCDAGTPLRNWEETPLVGETIDALCRNLANQVSIATLGGKSTQPSLTVR